MTSQCEGMGEVGSARYEPALLPRCPSIRVLSYSNCQEIHSSQQMGLAVEVLRKRMRNYTKVKYDTTGSSKVMVVSMIRRCVVRWSCYNWISQAETFPWSTYKTSPYHPNVWHVCMARCSSNWISQYRFEPHQGLTEGDNFSCNILSSWNTL